MFRLKFAGVLAGSLPLACSLYILKRSASAVRPRMKAKGTVTRRVSFARVFILTLGAIRPALCLDRVVGAESPRRRVAGRERLLQGGVNFLVNQGVFVRERIALPDVNSALS